MEQYEKYKDSGKEKSRMADIEAGLETLVKEIREKNSIHCHPFNVILCF